MPDKYYATVIYPKVDLSRINSFKEKHDPYYPGIGAHLTLVFPTPEEVGDEVITKHVEEILAKYKPFDIHLAGFEKAWDHWLFLNVKEGNEQIVRLHDELYTGSLESYLRKDIPFSPHIALGLFAAKGSGYSLENPTQVQLDEKAYKEGLEEAERLGLDYKTTVDAVHLLKLGKDLRTKIWDKEISLS